MTELYDEVYAGDQPIIDSLLYPGIFLLSGAPKIGKSFLVLQMAFHISTGTPLWGLEAAQNPVLYLSLEDSRARLQKRLYRMFGEQTTGDLHLATVASRTDADLLAQLQSFLEAEPETRLIIIDTLQKVRESSDQYSYSNDYLFISALKTLADRKGLCILLVHHNRKQRAEDPLEEVSGTTGLTGASDGTLVLTKKNRTDDQAELSVTGRDLQDQRFYLQRDQERLSWNLIRVENACTPEPPDPVLSAVAGLLSEDRPSWDGTATELMKAIGSTETPIALSMRLTTKAGQLLHDYGVSLSRSRSREERLIHLRLVNG